MSKFASERSFTTITKTEVSCRHNQPSSYYGSPYNYIWCNPVIFRKLTGNETLCSWFRRLPSPNWCSSRGSLWGIIYRQFAANHGQVVWLQQYWGLMHFLRLPGSLELCRLQTWQTHRWLRISFPRSLIYMILNSPWLARAQERRSRLRIRGIIPKRILRICHSS